MLFYLLLEHTIAYLNKEQTNALDDFSQMRSNRSTSSAIFKWAMDVKETAVVTIYPNAFELFIFTQCLAAIAFGSNDRSLDDECHQLA